MKTLFDKLDVAYNAMLEVTKFYLDEGRIAQSNVSINILDNIVNLMKVSNLLTLEDNDGKVD